MKDSWFSHNTDKLLLLLLVVMSGFLIIHIMHHGMDKDALAWAENEFATFAGALILILTGRVNRADGQTSNGAPPTPSAPPYPARPPELQNVSNTSTETKPVTGA